MRSRFVDLAAALAVTGAVTVVAPARAQQGTAVLTGTILDATTKKVLPGVVVTVTSDDLLGWQTVTTDSAGQYRIPNLPPGDYTLGLDLPRYKPFARGGISLRADATIRVDAEMTALAPAEKPAPAPPPGKPSAKELVVDVRAPSVDVGSGRTGMNVTQDFSRRVPIARPGTKGGATRSFESAAEVVPGARYDDFGVSISGTTSPENQYLVDGLSVNDPAYGVIGTPLSIEFVREVNVISGGYMPEYGRATGGVLNVVTKSGSNDIRGSIFGSITPGAFEGPRALVRREASTISTDRTLKSIRDVGFEIGGPIVDDRLWFYGGMGVAISTYQLERNLNVLLPSGPRPIPGTQRFYDAEERTVQYIGKLSLGIDQDNKLDLTVFGAPTWSGGEGTFGFDPQRGVVERDEINGSFDATAHRFISTSNDVVLRYSSAFDDKDLVLDVSLGWHHQYYGERLPVDGTGPDDVASGKGIAGDASIHWRKSVDPEAEVGDPPSYHSITEFERLPDPAVCFGPAGENLCPVDEYFSNGSDFMAESKLDRYQGRVVVTRTFRALGAHVLKVGIDVEQMGYTTHKAYSGGTRFYESTDGTTWDDYHQYGFLIGPDQAVILDSLENSVTSTTVGGFVQDSWNVADKVTVNVGIRYDAQFLFNDAGQLGMALPNQWSPRVGAVYDFTQKGRSKIFASFARYYESVPLNIAERALSGDPEVQSTHDASLCNPRVRAQQRGECRNDASRLASGDPADPNQLWIAYGAGKTPIDPDLSPQSSDEIVAGVEYEIIDDGRLGVSYTRRYMVDVIEDMSRDEAYTYFIGNPGKGIASDFPEATRDYDAVTLYFQKAWRRGWLAQGSYTISALRGNWAGLYRPETLQLDPNINADFDLKSLTINRDGPLPGDHTHDIKLFGAKEIRLPKRMVLLLGGGLRARSGEPTSYLGADPLYGTDEVFILPRGAGERLPWVFSVDPRIGWGVDLTDDSQLMITMDVFNIFNFQEVTAVDERWTISDVTPIPNGTRESLNALTTDAYGDPLVVNPNYGKPIEFQSPRTFRFGARLTF